MIKTLSPYYYNVPLVNPNTSVVCNSYVFKLYVWNGIKYASPVNADYISTKINAAASNTTDKIDIARLVNDFIDFNCSQSVVTSLENGDNQVWAKVEVYYDDEPTTAQLQQVLLATKGYGYFMEGENPQIPANKILLEGDEFKVNRNGIFALPILLDEIHSTLDAINDTFDIYYQDTILDVIANDNLGFTPTIITGIISSIPPTVGVLSIESNNIKFTAGVGYTTPQIFQYTIMDNSAAESTATVTLNISDLPTTVTAIDDVYSSDGLTVQDLMVLDNDVLGTLPTDIISIDLTGFTMGTVDIDPTNQFLTFTPNGTPGPQTFEYTIEDSTATTSSATVTINVDGLYSFYYEGTEETPIGNVGYIDINDELQEQGDLILGTCVLIVAKSIAFVISAQTCTP